jgi:hypothetical protein
VVGDRERIDIDLAHLLVTRLQAAGFELHRAMGADTAPIREECIILALAEMDVCIRLIRHAAAGFEVDGDNSSKS